MSTLGSSPVQAPIEGNGIAVMERPPAVELHAMIVDGGDDRGGEDVGANPDDALIADEPAEMPAIGPAPVDLGLPARIESLLFVAEAPVTLGELSRALDATRAEIKRALRSLEAALISAERGLRIQNDGGTVQMVTAPASADAIQRFLGRDRDKTLSRAALETLSIIAYRQPLTRPEVDDLRGVSSDGVLRTLMLRGLVEPVGRRETVGHPIEYGTTHHFLAYFGLQSLDDLPPIEAFAAHGEGQAGETDGMSEGDDDMGDDEMGAENMGGRNGEGGVDDGSDDFLRSAMSPHEAA